MPESAEVRRLRNEIAPVAGRLITGTRVVSGRYTRKPIAGFDRLAGYKIDSIGNKGKLLAFFFKPTNSVGIELVGLSTLGMTGWWNIVPSDWEAAPPTPHVRFRIDIGGMSLIFTDQRNFGTFKLTTKAGLTKKLKELGPDIAVESLPSAEFWLRLERYGKRKTIAEVMLDQRVFCGVGNYIRADAMYLSRIDPRTPALELSKRDLGRLWNNAHLVANAAFQDKHPLLHSGAFFANVCYSRSEDEHGHIIESYEDRGGRTVWWCPRMQEAR